jgi:hypothetical protein
LKLTISPAALGGTGPAPEFQLVAVFQVPAASTVHVDTARTSVAASNTAAKVIPHATANRKLLIS